MDDEFLEQARKAKEALAEGIYDQEECEEILKNLKEEARLRQQVRSQAEKVKVKEQEAKIAELNRNISLSQGSVSLSEQLANQIGVAPIGTDPSELLQQHQPAQHLPPPQQQQPRAFQGRSMGFPSYNGSMQQQEHNWEEEPVGQFLESWWQQEQQQQPPPPPPPPQQQQPLQPLPPTSAAALCGAQANDVWLSGQQQQQQQQQQPTPRPPPPSGSAAAQYGAQANAVWLSGQQQQQQQQQQPPPPPEQHMGTIRADVDATGLPMACAAPLLHVPMQMGKGKGRGRGRGRGGRAIPAAANAVPLHQAQAAKQAVGTHGGSRQGAGRKPGPNADRRTKNGRLSQVADLRPLETKVSWGEEWVRLCGVVANTGKAEEIPDGPDLLFTNFDSWEAFMERAEKVCADDCKTCMRCWVGAGVVTHSA